MPAPPTPAASPSPALLQLVLKLCPWGVLVVNEDGPYWWNDRAATQLGWTDGPSGLSVPRWRGHASETLPPDRTPAARALRGERVERERLVLVTGSGESREVECDAYPLPAQQGALALVLLRTLPTEGDSLGREREARLTAEAANRMKDEFLATVSHELRTPLHAVLGWASMLKNAKGDERLLEKGLDTIERNARAQAKLVDDLLDLGRIISGKLQVELAPVDASPLLEGAVEVVRPMAESKGVKLEVSLENSAGVSLLADAGRLQQIVWNLLNNAVKFTPQGGRVRMATLKTFDALTIEVSDTGIGISPSFLPRLFERFQQAAAGPVKVQPGLGLGLALVRHLVELHGGEITATSEGEDRGSTFRVSLPIRAARSG